MINYIVFSDEGEILRTGICPKDSKSGQGANVVEGVANDLRHYIKNSKVRLRPAMPINRDGLTLFNIPINCEIYVDNKLTVENNKKETITIEKEHDADSYLLRFVLFPYLDYEITL